MTSLVAASNLRSHLFHRENNNTPVWLSLRTAAALGSALLGYRRITIDPCLPQTAQLAISRAVTFYYDNIQYETDHDAAFDCVSGTGHLCPWLPSSFAKQAIIGTKGKDCDDAVQALAGKNLSLINDFLT